VLVRSIEDAALGIASIYRSMDLTLPARLPGLHNRREREWQRLLARVAPFDLVLDEETSWGEQVRVSPTSVCGRWGAVMGDLRYFSDRFGRARGSIEGTQIPYELLWEYADEGEVELVYDPGHRRAPLRARRVRTYQGFELDAEESAVAAFEDELAERARDALATAMAAGAAYHRDVRENRARVRELREVYRRSGGTTREISESALREYFLARLGGVGSYAEFLEAELLLNPDEWATPEERRRWLSLPDTLTLAGEECPLDYAIEEGQGVVRVRIPEKLLPHVEPGEVPVLDRPLHWTVLRGKREAVRATTLEEARELAARPRVELRQEGRLTKEEPPARRGGGRGRNGGGAPEARSGRGDATRKGGKGRGAGPRSGSADRGRDERSESRGKRRRERSRGGRGRR
jgi:ATP-dependent helicase HrpA